MTAFDPRSVITLLQSWINDGLLVSTDPANNDLERVVRGVLDIAESDIYADGDHNRPFVQIASGPRTIKFPLPFGCSPNTSTITIINEDLPEVANELFGRHGSLKLKAIILTADPHDPAKTRLSLALPDRSDDATKDSYVIVGFSLTSHRLSATQWRPVFNSNGPLKASLGLIEHDEVWSNFPYSTGSNLDHLLGPGCTALLRRCLPDLGAYLQNVAVKMRTM